MAISLVQNLANTGTSTTPSLTLGAAPIQNNLLVAFVRASTGTANVAANTGAGWSEAVEQVNSAGGTTGSIVYKIAGAGEATSQQPFTTTSVFWELEVLEFSGIVAASPLDKTNSASLAAGTSGQPGSTGTLSQPEEVIVAGMALVGTNGAGEAVDSSFNILNTATLNQSLAAYKIVSSTAAENPTFSWNTSRGRAGVIATFKAPALALTMPLISSTTTTYAPTLTVNTPPTVALNTADAHDFSTDTTPTLEFTGTDADSNDIRYNIQIDTANTFDSESGTPSVIDSYSEANQSSTFNIFGTTDGVGQSFTGDGSTLGSVKFYLKYTGSQTTQTLNAKIFAHSGTYGTSSVPTGSALATSDNYDSSGLTTSYQLIQFNFSGGNQITLVNGTRYVVRVDAASAPPVSIDVGVDSSSPSHSGNSIQGTSGFNGFDVCFYVYNAVLSTPQLDKVSGTDSGFVNTVNGGDTDPFTSGEKVSYTVQGGDALADGTYYWRVRGIDPSGSNTYGSWATARTFEIDTGGTQTLTLPLISSAGVLYAPTLTPQAVTLTLPLIASTTTLYAPTLTAGAVTLTLPNISSSSVLYEPTLTVGAISVTLPLISSTTVLYEPSLTQNLTLPVIASTATLYAPTLSVGAVTLTLSVIGSTTTLYEPTLTPGVVSLTMPLIASTEALYEPTLTESAATLELPAITSTATLHSPTLSAGAVTLTTPLISSTEAVFAPTLTTGAISITLPLIASTETVYEPSLAQSLSLPLISSTTTLTAPTLSVGAVELALPLIESTEATYAPSFSFTLTFPIISSVQVLYEPTITVGAVELSLPMIASIASIFAPTIADNSQDLEMPIINPYAYPRKIFDIEGNMYKRVTATKYLRL